MLEPTPRPSLHANNRADGERQRIDALFTEFLGKYRASQGTAVLPPPAAPKRRPCPLPTPEPGWRHLCLIDPPQISDERWEALSRSQVRAVRLLRQGQEGAALETLRLGTWHNPEEEVRQLLIYVHRSPRRVLPTTAIHPEEETAA